MEDVSSRQQVAVYETDMLPSESLSRSTRGNTRSQPNGHRSQEEKKSVLSHLLQGKRLSVAFDDYQQWARQDTSAVNVNSPGRRKSDRAVQLPPAGTFQFPRPGGSRLIRGKKEERKPRSTTSVAEIRVLKALIAARKRSIAEYTRLQKDLIQRNVALKEHITKTEVHAHNEVCEELQRCVKIQDVAEFAHKNCATAIIVARKELEDTSVAVGKGIRDIEQQVERLETYSNATKEELEFLISYKEKVFPLKASRIAELRQQLESLHSTQKDSLDGLNSTIDTERQKHQKKEQMRKTRIHQLAVDNAVSALLPGSRSQTTQNEVMKKEIAIHRIEVERLRCDTEKLEAENKRLQQEIKLMVKLPQQRQPHEKCLPTTDLKLDIPEHEWLPV